MQSTAEGPPAQAVPPPSETAPPPAGPPVAQQLAPLTALAAALSASVDEAQQKLGCAKCRHSRGGCARCRNPNFKPRQPSGTGGSRQQQRPGRAAAAPAAAAPGLSAAGEAQGAPAARPPVRRAVRGKRQRTAPTGHGGSSSSRGEPLVHALRRQLHSLQTQSSGAAESPQTEAGAAAGAHLLAQTAGAAAAAAAAAGSAAQPAPAANPQQQQQQQQQPKRAANAAAPGGRPAKFFKADTQLASSLQLQQQRQQQAQHQQQWAGAGAGGPLAATAAASKRAASSEPSPASRRATKRHRAGSVPAAARQHGHGAAELNGLAEAEAAAAAATAAAAVGAAPAAPAEAPAAPAEAPAEAAASTAKRPAATQQQPQQHHRPSKFRRLAPPTEQQQSQQAQQQQQQDLPPQQQAEQQVGSVGSAGSAERMDIDHPLSPRKRAASQEPAAAADSNGGSGRVRGIASPSSADFLAQLEQNMQLRHQQRQAASQQGTAAGPPHPLLALPASAAKRLKQSPRPASAAGGLGSPGGSQAAPASAAAAAAAAAAGAAAAAEEGEPDPRLCLWEPPASPYGLLEEELYDDPWKLLVACMLLNKTSGTQVRKVIWDLFTLCPTPAAAIAADVQQVQALIQPLGLFRKRALAIQQLSQDYLYKQWRHPTELFGIGKYAADAYLMFCRGRWREVQPDDKDLRKYREWLEQTGGLGTGLTRHRTMQASPPAATARGTGTATGAGTAMGADAAMGDAGA